MLFNSFDRLNFFQVKGEFYKKKIKIEKGSFFVFRGCWCDQLLK